MSSRKVTFIYIDKDALNRFVNQFKISIFMFKSIRSGIFMDKWILNRFALEFVIEHPSWNQFMNQFEDQ